MTKIPNVEEGKLVKLRQTSGSQHRGDLVLVESKSRGNIRCVNLLTNLCSTYAETSLATPKPKEVEEFLTGIENQLQERVDRVRTLKKIYGKYTDKYEYILNEILKDKEPDKDELKMVLRANV